MDLFLSTLTLFSIIVFLIVLDILVCIAVFIFSFVISAKDFKSDLCVVFINLLIIKCFDFQLLLLDYQLLFFD